MAEAHKPVFAATPALRRSFQAQYVFVGATSEQEFLLKNPGVGSALGTPGADMQWAILALHLSLSAAGTITLWNDTGGAASTRIWGPHAFPAAGVFVFYFPNELRFGSNKKILFTNSAGNGTCDIIGVRIPVVGG